MPMFAFSDFVSAPTKDVALQTKLNAHKNVLYALTHPAARTPDSAAAAAELSTAAPNSSATTSASASASTAASAQKLTPAMSTVTSQVCAIFGPPKCGKTSLLFHAAYQHALRGGHPLLIFPTARDSSALDSKRSAAAAAALAAAEKPQPPRLPPDASDDVLRRIRIKSVANEAELRLMLASLPYLTVPANSLTTTTASASITGKPVNQFSAAATATNTAPAESGSAFVDLLLIDDFSGVHMFTPYHGSTAAPDAAASAGGTRKYWANKDSYSLDPNGECEVLCKSLAILYASVEHLVQIGRECRVVLSDTRDLRGELPARVASAVFDRFIAQSFTVIPQLLTSGEGREFRLALRSCPSVFATTNPAASVAQQMLPGIAPAAVAQSTSATSAFDPLPLDALGATAHPASVSHATSFAQQQLTAITTGNVTAVHYLLTEATLLARSIDPFVEPKAVSSKPFASLASVASAGLSGLKPNANGSAAAGSVGGSSSGGGGGGMFVPPDSPPPPDPDEEELLAGY